MELHDIPLLSGPIGFRGHIDEFERDRYAFLDRVGRELPELGRLRFLKRDVVIVNSPSAIHEVLVEKARCFEKSPLIRIALHPLAGEGLPDRFAPGTEASRPRDAWIPFSDGPRICIGAHFAQLEAPLVLATLLQRADFSLPDAHEIVPDASGTLRPRGGVPMRVKLREALRSSA